MNRLVFIYEASSKTRKEKEELPNTVGHTTPISKDSLRVFIRQNRVSYLADETPQLLKERSQPQCNRNATEFITTSVKVTTLPVINFTTKYLTTLHESYHLNN